MGSLPSISPNKIAERPDNLFQYISEVVGSPNGKRFGKEIGERIHSRARLYGGSLPTLVPELTIQGVNR
jgi:hypothetical protein